MLRNAQTVCGIAQALALWAAVAGAPALLRAQDPEPRVAPAVQAEVTLLLDHTNPEMRGEAALALAVHSPDQSFYSKILAMAQDREAAARHRAILAVGLLGSPGADVFLGDLLTRSPTGSVERLLAALALGMLPEAASAPARDEFLHRIQGGSIKRHRDAMAAMLVGLSSGAHPSKMQAMRELLGDAAIKDLGIRRLLIRVLAGVPSPENTRLLVRAVDASTAEVSISALQALTDPRCRLDNDAMQQIHRLARRSGNPGVRAAALDVLVSRRQAAALDLAPKAIGSKYPSMIGAGVRAALSLGGGSLRKELDNSTLLRRDPLQQAMMLEVSRGPHAREFLLRISEIAKRKDARMELRVQAAAVVAAAGWKSIVPTLSNLFLVAEQPRHLHTLAECLQKLDVDLTAKVYPPTSLETAHRLPARLRALIAAGNTNAVAAVSKALKSKDVAQETKLEMLRAYRLANQPWPEPTLRLAPDAVQALLR